MNGFFQYFDSPKIPNHQSKTPFTQIWLFSKYPSNQIHAGFKPNQTRNFNITNSVRFMTDSCQVHAEFMHFQLFIELVLYWRFFSKILVQIWLGRGWCWIHAEFVRSSCWSHVYLNFSTTLCATFCITMVLNSCWSHAEFKQNREKAPRFCQ